MKSNPRALNQAVEDVRDRTHGNSKGRWEGATVSTLLGLYAHLHEVVYGVFPDELEEEWYPAMSKAKAFTKKKFGDDVSKVVEFMRWVWQRERHSVETYKEKNDGEMKDFRISWRYQFSTKLLTDYRMAKAGNNR